MAKLKNQKLARRASNYKGDARFSLPSIKALNVIKTAYTIAKLTTMYTLHFLGEETEHRSIIEAKRFAWGQWATRARQYRREQITKAKQSGYTGQMITTLSLGSSYYITWDEKRPCVDNCPKSCKGHIARKKISGRARRHYLRSHVSGLAGIREERRQSSISVQHRSAVYSFASLEKGALVTLVKKAFEIISIQGNRADTSPKHMAHMAKAAVWATKHHYVKGFSLETKRKEYVLLEEKTARENDQVVMDGLKADYKLTKIRKGNPVSGHYYEPLAIEHDRNKNTGFSFDSLTNAQGRLDRLSPRTKINFSSDGEVYGPCGFTIVKTSISEIPASVSSDMANLWHGTKKKPARLHSARSIDSSALDTALTASRERVDNLADWKAERRILKNAKALIKAYSIGDERRLQALAEIEQRRVNQYLLYRAADRNWQIDYTSFALCDE